MEVSIIIMAAPAIIALGFVAVKFLLDNDKEVLNIGMMQTQSKLNLMKGHTGERK